jgi:hypothetical protein
MPSGYLALCASRRSCLHIPRVPCPLISVLSPLPLAIRSLRCPPHPVDVKPYTAMFRCLLWLSCQEGVIGWSSWARPYSSTSRTLGNHRDLRRGNDAAVCIVSSLGRRIRRWTICSLTKGYFETSLRNSESSSACIPSCEA